MIGVTLSSLSMLFIPVMLTRPTWNEAKAEAGESEAEAEAKMYEAEAEVRYSRYINHYRNKLSQVIYNLSQLSNSFKS